MDQQIDVWQRIYKENRVENLELLPSIFSRDETAIQLFLNSICEMDKILDYGAGYGRNLNEVLEKNQKYSLQIFLASVWILV